MTIGNFLVLSSTLATACLTDSVPPDNYGVSPPERVSDAAADARKPTPKSDAGSRTTPSTRSDTGPDTAPDTLPGMAPDTVPDPTQVEDGGANRPPVQTGDNGPCDLTGHWLIAQRTVAQGLGVRQAGLWWYYYELEQSGSELIVKKGLVCGGEVRPVDLLAASVDWPAAWPAIISKNSHAGRSAQVTASGSQCNVSFERGYSVVGATTPYYADPANRLPTLDQEASGSTPGWEDWDNDGQPAVSLLVGGIVTGARYTALRAWSEWSGKIAAGASNFKLAVTWNQEEAVLGVTTDLLKETGVPDADRTLHFAQFAKLTPDQVRGDDAAICATIIDLSPTLASEADF